ncbi:MAG: molybdopterin-dependent oxidoreductase [Actinomycetota bacterium]
MSLRRAGRGTNLTLLVLLVTALLTGALAFANGGDWAGWALAAHGAAGLGILLLAPWKSVVSARGLRRSRPGAPASVALVVLILLTIVSGLGHATGLWASLLAMQVHVGAALTAIPLAIWHVVARPVRARRSDLSRRTLVRAGVIAGGAVAAFGAVEAVVRVTGLPGSDRRATGSYEAGSFEPAEMPVTQWLDDAPPAIDAAAWHLEVRTPSGTRAWTYDELLPFDDRMRAILDCTGGWFAEQEWSGIRLDRLLGGVEDVRSVVAVSAMAYNRRFPVSDAGSMLLATRVGGRPLSQGHGFPARIVAPGRRGFWWVKWVERLETSGTPWWWQSPFPLT